MSHPDQHPGPLSHLHADLRAGRISRRQFLNAALALGVGLPVATFIVNATSPAGALAQDAATPEAGGPISTRPTAGTDGQTRGAGGELKVLEWQAPSNLSVHAASGGADISAASLVTEPLLSYAPDGTLLPALASEVPTVENGGLSADLTVITYKLLPNVVWSDGQPFTADDVIFTWQWIINPDNKSVDATTFGIIANIEAVDPLTAKVTLNAPSLGWYVPFTSSNRGGIYPKHSLGRGRPRDRQYRLQQQADRHRALRGRFLHPERPGDLPGNENYREPNKPFFDRVNYKGGGDAPTAAAAVLQTGDWDFAWQHAGRSEHPAGDGEGRKGQGLRIIPAPRSSSRSTSPIPNKEVDGQKSQKAHPEPGAQRQRRPPGARRWPPTAQTISEHFYYGPPAEPPDRNILPGIAGVRIDEHHLGVRPRQGQRRLLDAAGWI